MTVIKNSAISPRQGVFCAAGTHPTCAAGGWDGYNTFHGTIFPQKIKRFCVKRGAAKAMYRPGRAVGLSMMCYRLREANKTCLGERQRERTHGEIVVSPFTDSKLGFEIIKAIETVRSIEFFVIFTVAALHFAIVTWGVWTDELVTDTKLFQFQLKERGFIGALRQEAV